MWPDKRVRGSANPAASPAYGKLVSERLLGGMSGRLHSSEGCKRVLGLGSHTVPHETASFTELYLAFYVIFNGTLRNSRTRATKQT
jgi:hypothetical protein